jgi:hypothetical protein
MTAKEWVLGVASVVECGGYELAVLAEAVRVESSAEASEGSEVIPGFPMYWQFGMGWLSSRLSSSLLIQHYHPRYQQLIRKKL